jgi:1,4-alpha-glucan branching enzyme
VKLKEAASRGQSIVRFEPASRAAKEFLALADELVAQEGFYRIAERREVATFRGPQRVPGGVRFEIEAPHAQEVRLTGQFSGWSYEGIPLLRDGNGLWSAVVPMESGAYEYRFILDGVWVKDPSNAESVLNEFGQENSVVVV